MKTIYLLLPFLTFFLPVAAQGQEVDTFDYRRLDADVFGEMDTISTGPDTTTVPVLTYRDTKDIQLRRFIKPRVHLERSGRFASRRYY